MKSNKIYSTLSLAMKAGHVASGEFATEKAVKSDLAELVVVSADASDNTKKKFRNMCSYYEVPIAFYGSKAELGHCIGKETRASLAVIDKGLAESVWKQIETVHRMEVEHGEN
ncbi:MAG: L7Ae/L30e/S12e/Gadd45 family ribosomal protein [Lachnospiraceae bacterium]